MFATASYTDAWAMVHRYVKKKLLLTGMETKGQQLWHLACTILMKLDEKGTKQLFQECVHVVASR